MTIIGIKASTIPENGHIYVCSNAQPSRVALSLEAAISDDADFIDVFKDDGGAPVHSLKRVDEGVYTTDF